MNATKKKKALDNFEKKEKEFEKELNHYNLVKLELEVLGSTRGKNIIITRIITNTFQDTITLNKPGKDLS